MNSRQYEELCRYFVANKVGLPIDKIRSGKIPNPRRPGHPDYNHQIDLQWETGDQITSYQNIANAKWRGSALVDQPDIMLLQKVREKVAAHKAFMITNVGFTKGAIAAAKDEKIALHVVAPSFDTTNLPKRDRAAIQTALEATAADQGSPVFTHRVELRGLGFAHPRAEPHRSSVAHPGSRPVPYETRVITQPTGAPSFPMTNRSLAGRATHGGPGFTRGNFGGGGFVKK